MVSGVTPLISTSLPAPSRPRLPIARASMSNIPCITAPVLFRLITPRISASISSTWVCALSARRSFRSYLSRLRSHLSTSAARRSSLVMSGAAMISSSAGCHVSRCRACLPCPHRRPWYACARRASSYHFDTLHRNRPILSGRARRTPHRGAASPSSRDRDASSSSDVSLPLSSDPSCTSSSVVTGASLFAPSSPYSLSGHSPAVQRHALSLAQ